MAANAALVSTLALYATITIGLITLCTMVVGSIAFWRAEKGAARTFSLLLQRANVLQMLAIFLIIVAACVLRLADSINSEAIVSILSGVAGYVLGGTTRSRHGDEQVKAD